MCWIASDYPDVMYGIFQMLAPDGVSLDMYQNVITEMRGAWYVCLHPITTIRRVALSTSSVSIELITVVVCG